MSVEKQRRPYITGGVIMLLGVGMLWPALQLLINGGTPYYLAASLLLLISGQDLIRGKSRGFYSFAILLLMTLVWAVHEAGTDFWSVGSRIWLIGLLALWLCTPWIRRKLWDSDMPSLLSMRTVQVCGVTSLTVLLSMIVNVASENINEIPERTELAAQNESDWTAYGGSQAGTRYAPLDQINQSNVHKLAKAWEFDTGRIGRLSATPIQIGDGIYLCTAQNVMMALDADSGEERWRFDPENDTPPFGIIGNCRGVTYVKLPDAKVDDLCAERIVTATTDARMIAVDKNTGQACSDFGDEGQISLLAGMGEVKPYYYFVTSPPTLASGVLVVGGWVADNQETNEPSGVVRAYDPRTGELAWAWDMGREGDTSLPPQGETYTRGTPNVWSLTAADDELGLVYVPTGNATPDYFGGHRTEIMDKYASSIVAIDAKTGLTRWHFQTTHHDIWDYDVPSQPTLVDINLDGALRKAVIVPTKRGEVFLLDRVTGESLTEVSERPVPQTDLPNERSSATQPFSTGMPSFAHPRIREQDLIGITPFDQMACRTAFHQLRYEGPMTPPSVQGTLLYPGPAGGMNWGSVAVDEQRQLLVVNNLHLPWQVKMIPREEDIARNEAQDTRRGYGIGGPQRGTPFAARVELFGSPFLLPCLKPPYGEIAVVDLTTQQVVWRRGFGFMNIGLPYSAGSFVTAGGLIFNAGVMDSRLRAISVDDGKLLWSTGLERSSGGTPMSYVSPRTGKQYVLVLEPAAGGREQLEESHQMDEAGEKEAPAGGKVIAYALAE